MKFIKVNENQLGLHIEFDTEITVANFREACQLAIDLAKTESGNGNIEFVNFVAFDIPVQVGSAETVENQFSLLTRWVNIAGCDPITEKFFSDRQIAYDKRHNIQPGDRNKTDILINRIEQIAAATRRQIEQIGPKNFQIQNP